MLCYQIPTSLATVRSDFRRRSSARRATIWASWTRSLSGLGAWAPSCCPTCPWFALFTWKFTGWAAPTQGRVGCFKWT